ncbi:MAG: alpha/beta fold hydrolase [Dehalococcoidia bacterium]|nr:alpha/beta fold hydrolase [Dehalococcoidia bacterium]MCB9485894.1 alpha/beta fold hydrolase [Thermoflexaceae bacterium]
MDRREATLEPITDPFFGDHSVQPVATAIADEFRHSGDWFCLRMSPVYYGIGVPRGSREPVVLVPGFFGVDLTMAEMYWWLWRIGYSPYYSGLGLNVDCPDASADALVGVVRRAVRESGGQQVRIVGHSLGGLLARSVAIDHPHLVEMLISLGSPFNDVARVHPLLIEAMAAVRSRAGQHPVRRMQPTCYSGHCSCAFTKNLLQGKHGGFRKYALYARHDGLVDWTSCIETDPTLNFGISTSHNGLITNAEAFSQIAERLANG